ncbi:MAG: four helix bundle protein [Melioribacteraceae bacterium]|nr:four helix bundle protein [Melioribacteraceae bacterium]
MRNFRNFDIWIRSMKIANYTYDIMTDIPNDEKYGLNSQIRRAVVSIPANIAEGCSRSTDKEFRRFIEIAIGSSFELETLLEICFRRQYIDDHSMDLISKDLNLLQKQLNRLHNKLS